MQVAQLWSSKTWTRSPDAGEDQGLEPSSSRKGLGYGPRDPPESRDRVWDPRADVGRRRIKSQAPRSLPGVTREAGPTGHT